MANEAKNKDAEKEISFVDVVMGGENPSPEPKKEELSENSAEPPQEIGDESESPFEEPSAESDKASPGKEEKKEEKVDKTESPKDSGKNANEKPLEDQAKTIETLSKRLRDTQQAYHKASSEGAAAKKELAELKAKQEKDDWFSESDKKKVEVLEASIKTSEAEQAQTMEEAKELEIQSAQAAWDASASKVQAEHPDFDQLVYDVLAPALDEKSATYDAAVKAEYNKIKDKSPASAYAFAKKLADFQAYVKDPEAFKTGKPGNNTNDTKTAKTIQGKEGLDLVNSASIPDVKNRDSGSFVDAVFK